MTTVGSRRSEIVAVAFEGGKRWCDEGLVTLTVLVGQVMVFLELETLHEQFVMLKMAHFSQMDPKVTCSDGEL